MSIFSLAHHAALVTGSSSGLGWTLAEGLRKAGAAVIRHGHDPRPDALEAEQPYLQSNLMEPGAPEALVDAAFQRLPALDTLVGNAGSFCDLPFLEMTPERWEKTIQLNLRSNFFLVQAFARRLKAAGRPGSVVLTASINGLLAATHSTAYDASKGALLMLVRSLSVELGPLGIRVNALAPGLIRTPLTRWMDTDTRKRDHYIQNVPLGRMGVTEDCAGAVVFLVSDAASFITGQTLVVDGGLSVRQSGDALPV